MSKTESRFKSKLESLKKLQHSASNSSAVEKARAFFRSLERKHLGSAAGESSSSRRRAVPSSISSSSSSSVVDDTPTPIRARVIRVNNPKDLIVHRVIDTFNGQALQSPKRCYPIGWSSERSHSYSGKPADGHLSQPTMTASMYNYRPLVCRQMNSPSLMSSSFHEESPRLDPPPISSWSQSVRRLNNEYASTIHALQQARESLEQIQAPPIDCVSKYANLVARGINDLSNAEPKRSLGVTFCLTAPIFSKPKVIRPVELETFTPVPFSEEKSENIGTIIEKFNNLRPPSASNGKCPDLKKSLVGDPVPSFELEEIPYESGSSSISEDSTRSSTSTSDENLVHPPEHTVQQEETTYTVETFYTNEIHPTRLLPLPEVMVIRENTTAEQFNLAQEEPSSHKPSELPALNSPLLTYLNLAALKQTKASEEDKRSNDLDTVVTLHPPSQSSDLISSSSSSSTNSSTSTVLLSPPVLERKPLPAAAVVVQTKSSQLPKRTPLANVSRLKAPSSSSSSTKSIKSMLTNHTTTTTTTTLRKPTGITNQSSTMTNSIVNKQSSTLTGKKLPIPNATPMTDSSNSPADTSVSVAKNRVRSMVNQLNAASHSDRRIPTRLAPTSTRPLLQRAMTINHETLSPPPAMSHQPQQQQQPSVPSAYRRKAPLIRSTSNVKEGLLRWCQAQVVGYPNVSVTNLSSSWSDGLAFCALVHHFFPDAFDFQRLSASNRKENFELAFQVAEERADVPRLLDVSDMLIMGNTPDYKCIFTYLNSFLAKVKDIHPQSNGH